MKRILIILFLVPSISFAQKEQITFYERNKEKISFYKTTFLIGWEYDYNKKLPNDFTSINELNPSNGNLLIGVSSKYIDLGFKLNLNRSTKQNTNYELGTTIVNYGGNIDLNLKSIFWPHNTQKSNFFIRINNAKEKGVLEDYRSIETETQLWTLSGEIVTPGTPGAVPSFNSQGEPIIGWVDLYQVVEFEYDFKKFNYGIGYSFNKKTYSLKAAVLHSKISLNYKDLDASGRNYVFQRSELKDLEIQISVSINLYQIFKKS